MKREVVLSETSDLGGGCPASVPFGCRSSWALGQPGGCGSVDFGPETASRKGNRVGLGFLFPSPQALATSPHPNLLSLNSEGVAGVVQSGQT